MKLFTSILFVLFGTFLTAQAEQSDSLFSASHWTEEGSDYIMVLAPEGSFEEDAGENFTRPARYLMGRWSVDSANATLTLSVDGLMASNLSTRYKRGRDYHVVYDIILIDAKSLHLRDQLTGKERIFAAKAVEEYVEPAFRRLPKTTDEGMFKLPTPPGWGGL